MTDPAELAIPVWWRLLMSTAFFLAGVIVVTAGLSLGDWFINHTEDTETTLMCDDDYYFDEDESDIEFLDGGCVRVTEDVNHSLVHGWPFIAAAPVLIVFAVVFLALVLGGAATAIMFIVMCWDKDMDDTFKARLARRLTRKNR